VRGIYAVMQFKQLKDVEGLLSSFGKSSVKESEFGDSALWSIAAERAGDRNLFTQKFLLTLEDKKKAKAGAAKPADDKAAEGMNDLEEQLKPLILSLMRLRFTLHTPAPITSSNADIVLGERTAVWNCSLSKFAKEKTPIEMKASF